MWRQFGPALRLILALTVLTGLVYPLLLTGVCGVLFPRQANGSLVTAHGQIIGSSLIGQSFARPEYFHGRPSAAGTGYDPTASSPSNLGPTSAQLIQRVKAAVADFRAHNSSASGPLPSDLLTASGSGLDPDLSPASALIQVARVAQARGASPGRIAALVRAHITGRQWGFLGEPRVNVLELNLALDQAFPMPRAGAHTP